MKREGSTDKARMSLQLVGGKSAREEIAIYFGPNIFPSPTSYILMDL